MFYIILSLFVFTTSAQTLPHKGFDLKSGKDLILNSTQRQPTVVVFLSAKCPCSAGHEKHLEDLKQKFPTVNFIGIHSNANESLEISRQHFQKSSLTFPILQDQEAKWADEWKALKTPHAFLVDAEGKIIYRGGVTNSPVFDTAKEYFLLDALTAQQQHKSVKITEGRTLGCFIER